MSTPDSFNFDEEKLNSLDTVEKRELLLFQWLSTLEKDLIKFGIKEQPKIEQFLMKYLNNSVIHPNKPTRHLISRCFVILYSSGDQRSLFDTLTQMQSILSKKLDDNYIKMYD